MVEDSAPSITATLHSHGGTGVVRVTARLRAGVADVWSALTDPRRLARWYGTFAGDLSVGGSFTAFIPSSGWDGHGRVDECVPNRRLRVTMWEAEDNGQWATAELSADGDTTTLTFEKVGLPLDVVWAFGCGWQSHFEDLAAHLEGREDPNWPSSSDARFQELEPSFRAMPVTPLDP